MADHCRISSEIRSSFGRFEVADIAFTDERVDVFNLLTGEVNRTASLRSGPHDNAPLGSHSSAVSAVRLEIICFPADGIQTSRTTSGMAVGRCQNGAEGFRHFRRSDASSTEELM